MNNDYARFKVFLGANSKELLHYIDPTLEHGLYNTAVLHVRVNDLLEKNSLASVENLLSNLISAGKKCQTSGIEICISSIALNRTTAAATVKSINEKIAARSKENSFTYVENSNNLNSHCLVIVCIYSKQVNVRQNFINTANNFCTCTHMKTKKPNGMLIGSRSFTTT